MKKVLKVLLIFCAVCFTQEIGARYLIITHDNFYDAIQPLAQWKHKKGMRTKVVKLSDIGSDSTQIKNYITDAYNNWQIRPEFLLLVGAPNYLPFFPFGSYNYSDNYYTDIEGDIHNDILSGRLTVHNTTEAQTVVNKILLYERTPYMDDSLWFINACLIVREDYNNPNSGDDSIYWSDITQASNLMTQAGYNTIDTLSSMLGNNASDIIQSVNAGRAFVLYRGQGVGNWWSPFDVNPDATANGAKLPIVLSITCRTIGTSSNPATAEKWLLTGTPTAPKGGAGYFATTRTTSGAAHLRSAVSKGFFNALFVDSVRTFGEACEGGRQNVYHIYNSSSEYRGFTTLGDPEMNIWTAIPKSVNVSHISSLSVDDESLGVLVELNSTPLESALVCIMLDTVVYQHGYTADNGKITFYFDSLIPGEMNLTVTGNNILPYETTIPIIATDIYLTYCGNTINDSLANNNGIPESGETILLRTIIKNIGGSTAQNVIVTLSTDNTLISIIDSVVSFGNIYSQDSSFGSSPFVFSISPFYPGGDTVDFNLLMSDASTNTWTSNFSIIINSFSGATGPDQYGYYIYDDTDTLSGNAPEFDWFEIAPPGPGTIVSEITNEDADTVTLPLPFTFTYYGEDYNTIGVCSNGFTEFPTSTYRFGDFNTGIPDPAGPRAMLAPFWDDLNPAEAGDIYQYY
ncbi:hypothetical protein KAT67_02755, partial [candidate division WOR-3 bacterium]|nr:hypothetical protein [candidate division WOR-3 bacterium]